MRISLLFATLLLLPAGAAAQDVTGLAGWDLFLDPGHGGSNQNVGVFGYSEADKVLNIGLHLRAMLLDETDIDAVYLSRTGDIDVSLAQRVDLANSSGADHFHSIHSNAAAPEANFVFVLWPQYPDGAEAVPPGGRRMAQIMGHLLARGMRIPERGPYGECDFYGASNCRSRGTAPKGSRNYVQGFTVMPSELSEAGFHTNPRQNQLNMNADWKRLEARSMYWSILEYHDLPRPPAHIATGIVSDAENGVPINGATITIGDRTYTTDTYASLFHRYSNDPDELHNGFFYLEDLPGGTLPVTVEAEGFEPFEGEIAMVDTFFTFFDAALVSTVPPTVESSSPAPDEDLFKITAPIILDFSRRMDRASVEAALSIEPATGFSFLWTANDTRLIATPDTLLPQTDYTLTIGATAVGQFGHAFDGDGDGTAGDAFTLTFRTGFPDTQPPLVQASYPRVNASGVELQPIASLTYNEPLDASSLEGRVRLERTSDGAGVPGTYAYYEVGERSVVSFFPAEELAPGTAYRLLVDAGVRDVFQNEDPNPKQVLFTTGQTRFVATEIDAFDANFLDDWWAPQQSGSTTGIVTDSTGVAVEAAVVNPLTGSTASMRLDYGWDPEAGDWLVREYLGGGAPRSVLFDSTYALQAYVFGDGSGNLFRFAVDDNVPAAGAGNHEVSPWFEVDWIGWRLVSWRMASGETGAWIGDGTLDGALRFDSIQLGHEPGSPAYGQFFVDDLRVVKTEVATASEPAADVPAGFRLHQNYPNPFNPRTTLRFDLGAPAAVTLVVYNALGAEVATLAHRVAYGAGTHELAWDAARLPSGVYFARLTTEGRTATVRMTLVK